LARRNESSPGSITSVAREPKTMPTFGTSPTLPSGNHVAVRPELDGEVLLDQRVGCRTALSDQC
jgi:hypothetical protein